MAHSTCSTTELHVQEQQKHNTGCATDVKYSKSYNEASLAKSDLRSLIFLAYQVGAVLGLYLYSYNPKLLKAGFVV